MANQKEFTSPPPEERRKDIACAIINVSDSFLARFRTLQPAVRALAMVISAVKKWRDYRRPNPPIQLAGKYCIQALPRRKSWLSQRDSSSVGPKRTSKKVN